MVSFTTRKANFRGDMYYFSKKDSKVETPVQSHQEILRIIDLYDNQEGNQFSLKEIAQKAELSSEQFQQIFMDWAKTSPEQFFECTSKAYTKELLRENLPTLFDTIEMDNTKSDFSYAPFTQINRMSPEELENSSLNIVYSFTNSIFGQLLIASSSKGICYMSFEENEEKAIKELGKTFPNAQLQKKSKAIHEKALLFLQEDKQLIKPIPLHVKGTDFQVKVWEALLKIPIGKVSTYGKIAEEIQQPKASRAVGTAIGSNLIAFIIPCHRVVQTSGDYGGFKWGRTRKTMILGWERALAKY